MRLEEMQEEGNIQAQSERIEGRREEEEEEVQGCSG